MCIRDRYFQRVSRFITRMFALYRETASDRLCGLDLEGLKARNRELYGDEMCIRDRIRILRLRSLKQPGI